ncbi:5'-nucleotidase [Massilia horti]|uniref:5'-nucleotidase n=1 Tax=Massilia horti TaxID=2562153 RepID=A0A4Y9SVA5_9BURK|nr:5'-nucleotidase [Massilia horti]TFW30540.1 5'-nucleotidase [Massilia horti]TFW30541.1 5'-nucleotidase [Massilia horti]
MPLDLSDTLVVGISATALFDLAEADAVFRAKHAQDPQRALAEYRDYMLAREKEPLADGTGMSLVRALLGTNRHIASSTAAPLVEVVVMSRNSPETGVRVLNNIRSLGLPISRHAFTGGESVVDYLGAFDVDLFVTTNVEDAQRVIDSQACAAAVLKPPPCPSVAPPNNQVRLAFDGDAVLFDDSSELVYRSEVLNNLLRKEDAPHDQPLADGPYAVLLRKLARLQNRLPFGVESSPVRIAIVSARSAPGEMRVISTLRHWGVQVNDIFFLDGVDKTRVVKAFRPHIFFDDQELHLDPVAKQASAARGLARGPAGDEPPLLVDTLVDDLPGLSERIDTK